MSSVFTVPRRSARWSSAVAFLLACSAVWVSGSSQTSPLTLVSTAWPPFTNEPGQPRFALDLVEAALSRIGLTAKTTIVSAAEFTPSLTSGSFDGSAAAWRDGERERVLFFSQPYLENRLVLIGRRGADVSATSLAGLAGKRIAIVEGYSYGETIDSAGPVFVRSRSEEDSLTRLLGGDADYTLMDELVVEYIVRHYPKESASRLQIGSTPLLKRELYLAIRRTHPAAESIITRFNSRLREMIADRTYHRLLHVDWIRADVTGDGVPEYVPQTDRPGPSEPQRAYLLFSPPDSTPRTPAKSGFYLGGNLYTDWASVPNRYKVADSQEPEPGKTTASLFTFRW